ncbi:heme-binding domain-containing protein [Bdellovibrionota bacterium FG-2]
MFRHKMFQVLLLSAMLALGARESFSHGTHEHKTTAEPNANKTETDKLQAKLREINRRYVEQIKPIFIAKCGDCHSSQIRYPWYYSAPGIRQLIDHDHNEAMKHLDISKDFPFGGHGSPKEDLRAIQENLEKDLMPPLRYRLMHHESALTNEEKKAVLEWAVSGESLLTK